MGGGGGGGGEGLSAVIKLVMTYFVNAGGDFLTLRAFFKRIMRGQVFFFFLLKLNNLSLKTLWNSNMTRDPWKIAVNQ